MVVPPSPCRRVWVLARDVCSQRVVFFPDVTFPSVGFALTGIPPENGLNGFFLFSQPTLFFLIYALVFVLLGRALDSPLGFEHPFHPFLSFLGSLPYPLYVSLLLFRPSPLAPFPPCFPVDFDLPGLPLGNNLFSLHPVFPLPSFVIPFFISGLGKC